MRAALLEGFTRRHAAGQASLVQPCVPTTPTPYHSGRVLHASSLSQSTIRPACSQTLPSCCRSSLSTAPGWLAATSAAASTCPCRGSTRSSAAQQLRQRGMCGGCWGVLSSRWAVAVWSGSLLATTSDVAWLLLLHKTAVLLSPFIAAGRMSSESCQPAPEASHACCSARGQRLCMPLRGASSACSQAVSGQAHCTCC